MIGKTISHYRILDKLGEGGMGVVYKAQDLRLKRVVALKFLPPEMMRSSEWKERFIREAQTASALDHPNICTIHEIDKEENQPFIAMAYVSGQSLSEKTQAGPLSIGEAVDIAVQVAEGLREAHDKGIVHRDIKSANIMVDNSGRVRIMDFGLAILSGKERLTRAATIMGTITYMSPEQARGEAVDYRTDIWSLGVVLYEMVTGAPPFDAPTEAALIYKIINEDPEPIAHLREGVPEPLHRTIKRSMQKDPGNRHEDMKTLAAELRSIRSGSPTTPIILADEERPPSIAVLPFVNMSADKEQEYFCDGLSEEIINALTQLEDLRVIARTSAFSFKGTDAKISDIGKELNVETVLEGSVRKAGNRLRITAQLIDVDGGHHMWSERYDREMDDVFAIQDEITLAIVDKLKPKLLGEETEEGVCGCHPMNVQAYDFYLRGRWFWNRMTGESLKKAIEYFEKTIALAPDCAMAYTGLADSYNTLPIFSPISPRETYSKAKEAALKALEIDDALGEAHASLASILVRYEWDWEGSEKEHKRALELNPGYATGHQFYAMYLSFLKRYDEALAEMKTAHELDPLSIIINAGLGNMYHNMGMNDQAIYTLNRSIEMDPDYALSHLFLGFAYLGKSMIEEATLEFQKAKEAKVGMSSVLEALIGEAYYNMDQKGEAKEIFDNLLERPRQSYISQYALARTHFVLGDIDEGFECLERAYEERDHWLCFLQTHPILPSIEDDPRFAAMLKKIGFNN